MATERRPAASFLKTILAAMVALALNGLWLLGQAFILRETEPLSNEGFLGIAVPVFLLLCWFALGFLIMKGLRQTNCMAELAFLAPPVLFTGVLLGLHLAFPPNEFLTVFMSLWFISVGYFAGGIVAWRGARSA